MILFLSAPLDVEGDPVPPALAPPLDVEHDPPVYEVDPPCLNPWACSCGLPQSVHYDFHGPAIIAGDPAKSTGLAAGADWSALIDMPAGPPALFIIRAPRTLDESAKWSAAGAPPPEWATGDVDQAAEPVQLDEAQHHLRCDQCDATTTIAPRSGWTPNLTHDFTGTHSVQWRGADWGEPGSVVESEPAPGFVIDWSQVGSGGDPSPSGGLSDAPPPEPEGRIEVVRFAPVVFEAPMILGRDGQPVDSKAEAMRERFIESVRAYAAADPRTTQTEIGPSEIGDPCEARVLRAALGFPPSNQPDPWASFVGQAVHAKLADVFLAANASLGRERFLVERRVYVTDGIPGTTDLAECRDDGTLDVIDHKIVGTDTYKLFTRKTNGGWAAVPKYATQLDLYGLAWQRAGKPPATVNLAIWPRSGFLDGLMVFQREPDYANAEAALDRMAGLVQLAVETKADEFDEPWQNIPTVAGKGCGFCPWFQGLAESRSRFACPEGAKYASDARAGTGPRGVAA